MQRNKNIDIELQVNKDQEIYADKFMIASAINNLLSNAIKFTPVGGTIKISTTLTDSDYVQVCISDNGIGIPPEDIAKLFRIDQSHTTIGTNNEKGSGLGLLLCKEFVEQNEGKIWVNSEPGKGSQFFFTVKGIG